MKKILLIMITLFASTSSYAAPQFDCHGNEPFWGLKLHANNIVFTREQQDTHLNPVSPHQQGNTFKYDTQTNGQAVTIVVKKEKCSDGMSDISYPYSVSYSGTNQTYSGCCKLIKKGYKQ